MTLRVVSALALTVVIVACSEGGDVPPPPGETAVSPTTPDPAPVVDTVDPAAAAAPAAADDPVAREAAAEAERLGLAHPTVALEIEGRGLVRIELLPEQAPATAANFATLVEKGFYDGTTFHRVIPGFMIQGGDPNTKDRDPRNDGLGGPGFTIPGEPNDVKHVRGVVSMANRGAPDTAGSQFFVVVADQPNLDGKYTAFGRVVDGMDVVDAIAGVETDKYGRHGPQDRPREDVVVKKATIQAPESAGEAPAAPTTTP